MVNVIPRKGEFIKEKPSFFLRKAEFITKLGPRKAEFVINLGCHAFHSLKALQDTTSSLFALEATQGQMNGFSSQLPFKRHLPGVASVGY